MTDIRSLYLLDPNVTFLNNGSYGACPREVFEVYQNWQRELESYPTEFFGERLPKLLQDQRTRLGEFVGARAEDLVLVPNATTAFNTVMRSIRLQPGEEILATTHLYSAVHKGLRFFSDRFSMPFRLVSIPLPVTNHHDFVEWFWSCVTDRTKVILLDHITSASALTLPIAEICRRAKARGILTVIDGAHPPGQIDLNLRDIGADLYFGNMFKWCHAPKGVAFLYADANIQETIDPLVVSHGWGEGTSNFNSWHEWQGTRDFAGYLSISAAIDFHRKYNWGAVQERCRNMASSAYRELSKLHCFEPYHDGSQQWFSQMVAFRLPKGTDRERLYREMKEKHRIDSWWGNLEGRPSFRVSIQGYNTEADLQKLFKALKDVLAIK